MSSFGDVGHRGKYNTTTTTSDDDNNKNKNKNYEPLNSFKIVKEVFFLFSLFISEGGDGGDGPFVAEETLKSEPATDDDAKPSITTAGN